MYRRRKVIKDDKPPIPTNIDGFNMVIKEDFSIRDKDTDEPYEFNYLVKDRSYNEARYKVFMDLVADVVEEKLQAEPYNFQKVIVPIGADPTKDVHSYTFMTPNAMSTTDKLIVLMPASNTRIGIWSNRILCDENIKSGSMMQVTDLVREKGYEVVILNSNANYWYNNKAWERPQPHNFNIIEVPGSEHADNHVDYVFHHIIRNVKAEKIAVLARGAGGLSFAEFALNHEFDFIRDRVKAVAITDSTHTRDTIDSDAKRVFMLNNCVNWAMSTEYARGTIIPDTNKGCQTFSSGQEITDYVMGEVLDEILNFIYIKMGDIEPSTTTDEAEEEEDLTNRELTQEERAALEDINILSVQ